MSIFKTYDIRGIYPQELDEKMAYKIGRAFATFLNPKNVAVCRDMRESSRPLAAALMRGITEQGANAIDIGMGSTPMLYFAITNYKLDGGIIVTASHNPAQWNGFKLCRADAIPLSEDTGIKEIEHLVKENMFNEPRYKGDIISRAVFSAYINHLLKFAGKIKPLKVVIDAGNGIAGLIMPSLFKHLNCELVPLYFELDGRFPNHEANPLKTETLAKLQKTVLEHKADLGVAFDGDGDRCVFVDDNGEIITGDLITALIAKEFLKTHPNEKILYDVRSSLVVREEIEANNGIPVMCRVGHALIKQQMRAENAAFGGELSGHYYFRDNAFTESDGIALLAILKIISEQRKPISEIVAPLRRYFHSGEINSEVQDKDAKLLELEQRYSDGRIIKLDGLSVYYNDYWFNVRKSNTESVLRLNLEANSKELMEQKRDEVLAIIRTNGTGA